ncbi:hypothetical protein, partial [Mesorhizobium sp.]|uniref:hypothetical protein n=1 Tax=Mesorhizobium sp. TaxID=1871066 RepID=UPI0025FDFEB6
MIIAILSARYRALDRNGHPVLHEQRLGQAAAGRRAACRRVLNSGRRVELEQFETIAASRLQLRQEAFRP